MKHSYWISAKVTGPGYDLTVACGITTEGALTATQVETTIPEGFRKNVGRPGAQVAVTSIFEFEAEDTFRTEALKAADDAERRLNDEGEYDRQIILEELITALRALS